MFRDRNLDEIERMWSTMVPTTKEIKFSEPQEESMKSIIDKEFQDRMRFAYTSAKQAIDSYIITGLEISEEEVRDIVQMHVGSQFEWLKRRVLKIFIDEVLENLKNNC